MAQCKSAMDGLEPVYSWVDGVLICNFDANGYRLPTEAEWEYAARAGTSTAFYSGPITYPKWSDPIDPNLDRIGWYFNNSGDVTKPVGQKEPNAFGLYDMAGNVWEWVWDIYEPYTDSPKTDPTGGASGYRLIRGGSAWDTAALARSATRISKSAGTNQNRVLGFRPVRTATSE